MIADMKLFDSLSVRNDSTTKSIQLCSKISLVMHDPNDNLIHVSLVRFSISTTSTLNHFLFIYLIYLFIHSFICLFIYSFITPT